MQESLAGLPRGARLAVAISGGLDSSVLLALAAQYAQSIGASLSAIHVHHGLSPNADAWAAFCGTACAEIGVQLELVKVIVPTDSGEGLEAAARRLRYQAFAAHAADHVLLAHHANDRAETLLFNLLRGAGVRGAAGMPASSGANGRYVRPLLAYSRADLEAHAKKHELRWVNDESNDDVSLSRNFIRHQILPVLEQRFPAAVDNLARSSEHFSEAQEMLDEMAQHDLAGESFPVPVSILAGLSDARARNVLRYLLAQQGLQAPASKRLQEVLRQFIEAAPDRHPCLDLPTYRLLRVRGRVVLELR